MKLKKGCIALVALALSTFSMGWAVLLETPETYEIASLLKVFQAYDIDGPIKLRRIGKAYDGGYVVPERAIQEADVIIGYGIFDDLSFEEDAARIYGKLAYGFDCTCPLMQPTQALCHFIPSCIVSSQASQKRRPRRNRKARLSSTSSFDQHLTMLGLRNKKIFVKMDIEGNEYDTMPDILKHASWIPGIVLEIHFTDLTLIPKALELLQSLSKDFLLVHVHGNNYVRSEDVFVTSNSVGSIPQVLELSYINKNIVTQYEIASDQTHPTPLDMPNLPRVGDAVFEILKHSYSNFDFDLKPYEHRIYSQNGEEGVIEKIFELIETTSKYYVEFGEPFGVNCNTRFLRERGWKGLLMGLNEENLNINLRKEWITAENINDLFKKYDVPIEIDLLSIDVDYNDFYLWKKICELYRPRVVLIEYNASHLPSEDKVVIYDPNGCWDGTNYYGASILALYKLGRTLGYSLVYAEEMGVNLFFIRDDVLKEHPIHFKNMNCVDLIYKAPRYGNGPNGGHPEDLKERAYLSAEDLLSQ